MSRNRLERGQKPKKRGTGYKPKTINIQPFDDFNTNDAKGLPIRLHNINDIAK